MAQENIRKLIAPCGLYCGGCSLRFAVRNNDSQMLDMICKMTGQYLGHEIKQEDLICDGCLSGSVAIMCRECKIRECILSKGLMHCSQCGDVPCQKIIDFRNDGLFHHMEVVDNINRHKAVGETVWESEQEKRYRCQTCGAALHWYSEGCQECGKRE